MIQDCRLFLPTEGILHAKLARAFGILGVVDQISATSCSQAGWGSDHVATGLAAARVDEVTPDKILHFAGALFEALTTKDGVGVVNDTLRVSGTTAGDGGRAVIASLRLTPRNVLSSSQGSERRRKDE